MVEGREVSRSISCFSSEEIPAREQHARRKAARQDLRVAKVSENSRWFNEYGPYALTHRDTNVLIAWGMSLDALESELREREG